MTLNNGLELNLGDSIKLSGTLVCNKVKLITLIFYHFSTSHCICLIVYIDNIVITGNDHKGIGQLKQHLSHHIQTKDLGKLWYFLGIEVVQSRSGISICQSKYALHILSEIDMMEFKLIDTLVKFLPNQGSLLETLEDIIVLLES